MHGGVATPATRRRAAPAIVTSTSYAKLPSSPSPAAPVPVDDDRAPGNRRAVQQHAPGHGLHVRGVGSHGWTTSPPGVDDARRADRRRAVDRRRDRARLRGAAAAAGACAAPRAASAAATASWVPPRANTCSWLRRAAADEVGVPPTVIATYSVPSDRVDRRRRRRSGRRSGTSRAPCRSSRRRRAGCRRRRRRSRGRGGRRDAAALGLRRRELPDPLARVDVDRADRAVVVPAREYWPKSPFARPRKTSPSENLRFFCVGVSACVTSAAVSAAAL